MIGVAGLVGAQLVGPGGRAQADATPVEAGSAIATSGVLGAIPIVGNTTLSVSAGDSSASYQDDEARSSSQTLDLGGIGVILANTPVCGEIILPSADQPPALTDDTDGGSPAASNHLNGAGAETVTATSSPESSSATTTPVGADIPGLLTVGGHASSSVNYINNSERQAQASSVVDLSLGDGLVNLDAMSWNATQDSGTTTVSQGSFTIGSIKVGSLTLPTLTPADLQAAVALANTALAILGLTIVLPTVSTNAVDGTVTVTPLEITLGHSALSDAVISPIIKQVSALETTVGGQTAPGSDCDDPKELVGNLLDPAETVLNVALGAFSPGGGFDLDLGGATADTSAPTDFADPFGSGALGVGGLGDLGVSSLSTSTALPPNPFSSSSATLPATAAAPTTTSTTQPPIRAALASSTHCETTSPAGNSGCWSGDATVVGAIAVGAGALLFVTDLRKSRRSRSRGKEALA